MIIYYLFKLTSSSKTFNNLARKLIILFELPILKFIFSAAGAIHPVPRNSVFESEHFNTFMSDIDFSIISSEDQFEFLFHTRKLLKIFLPNLGELEFYTPEEWEKINHLQNSDEWKYWNKIYIIRKLSWQRSKLKRAETRYEKLKQKRAISISLKKISQDAFPLNGSTIFPNLKDSNLGENFQFPFYSRYLEHFVSSAPTADIIFEDEDAAKTFLILLPENETIPEKLELRRIKKLLIIREYLLTRAALRLSYLERNFSKTNELSAWMKRLEKKELEIKF